MENGTNEDAVVRLSDLRTDQTVRWFFVQANSSAHIGQIPRWIARTGPNSRLSVMFGRIRNPSYSLSWVMSESSRLNRSCIYHGLALCKARLVFSASLKTKPATTPAANPPIWDQKANRRCLHHLREQPEQELLPHPRPDGPGTPLPRKIRI